MSFAEKKMLKIILAAQVVKLKELLFASLVQVQAYM